MGSPAERNMVSLSRCLALSKVEGEVRPRKSIGVKRITPGGASYRLPPDSSPKLQSLPLVIHNLSPLQSNSHT